MHHTITDAQEPQPLDFSNGLVHSDSDLRSPGHPNSFTGPAHSLSQDEPASSGSGSSAPSVSSESSRPKHSIISMRKRSIVRAPDKPPLETGQQVVSTDLEEGPEDADKSKAAGSSNLNMRFAQVLRRQSETEKLIPSSSNITIVNDEEPQSSNHLSKSSSFNALSHSGHNSNHPSSSNQSSPKRAALGRLAELNNHLSGIASLPAHHRNKSKYRHSIAATGLNKDSKRLTNIFNLSDTMRSARLNSSVTDLYLSPRLFYHYIHIHRRY